MAMNAEFVLKMQETIKPTMCHYLGLALLMYPCVYTVCPTKKVPL